MPNRPYIVGNWKMNGIRAMLAEARAIDRGAARHPAVKVAIAPPFTLIHAMAEDSQSIAVGGQDCHARASGAFTGDVSAAMLKDAGAGFTIVGHSERRAIHGEDDAAVCAKAEAALQAGLDVIVCVGETEAERDAGSAEQVVCAQLDGSLPRAEGAAAQLTVAYEPVWAIGTGRTASPAQAQEVHALIRTRFARDSADVAAGLRILYGGSVKANNAAELFGQPDIDGGLIGGASLVAGDFLAICAAA